MTAASRFEAIGDKVRAGETILGRLPEAAPTDTGAASETATPDLAS